jgi:hypothetical protein
MKATPEVSDPLFDFELQVARRADQLAREAAMQGRKARDVWFEAERQTRNPFTVPSEALGTSEAA